MEGLIFKSSDDQGLGIKIFSFNGVGYVQEELKESHRREYHSIVFYLEGSSCEEVDFIRQSISPSQILLIPKGAIHRVLDYSNLRAQVLLFAEDFFTEMQSVLLNGLFFRCIISGKFLISLTEDERKHIQLYLELLEKELASKNNNQVFILQNLMLALVNKLEILFTNQISSIPFINARDIYQKFIHLLIQHHRNHEKVGFYASSLQIPPRQLNNELKLVTGKTANELILEYMILLAKRMLCFQSITVKEIAFGLGYNNQHYFSRLFKKRTNLSPEEFRGKHAI